MVFRNMWLSIPQPFCIQSVVNMSKGRYNAVRKYGNLDLAFHASHIQYDVLLLDFRIRIEFFQST